jgi:hypothetical protein
MNIITGNNKLLVTRKINQSIKDTIASVDYEVSIAKKIEMLKRHIKAFEWLLGDHEGESVFKNIIGDYKLQLNHCICSQDEGKILMSDFPRIIMEWKKLDVSHFFYRVNYNDSVITDWQEVEQRLKIAQKAVDETISFKNR